MATLTGQSITSTYQDLLHISSATRNEGLTSTAKQIFDGEGIGSPLYIGTNTLEMTGTTTISGAFILTEKSSEPSSPTEGSLAFINDDLYIAKQS